MKIRTGWAKQKRGFTIIEVMIFLAVSGVMFIMAVVFINGKQGNVAFRQGMEAAASTITNTINTVANGEYPSMGNFTCTAGLSGGTPTFTSTTSSQGTNGGTNNLTDSGGCIFLGKVLQFGYDESAGNSDPASYSVYTTAGRQYAPLASGDEPQPVQTFSDAQPVAVTSPVDLTQVKELELGLTLDKTDINGSPDTGMYLCTSASCTTQISSVGFFGSFGSYNGGDAESQNSGAQAVTVTAMQSGVTPTDDNVLSNGQYVLLCFNYGNKSGNITIGGASGQQTSVAIGFNEKAPC